MHISVVIPALNEEKNIAKCLRALASQTVRERFEVLVVDNGSTDATRREAERCADIVNVRVIEEKQPGRGVARATGFGAAKGTIIFSTDADSMVPPDWINSYLRQLRDHPEAVAVTGPPCIQDCGPLRNLVFNLTTPYFVYFNQLYFGHPGLCGFSFAIHADAYRASGGFSAEDDAYEDLALACRVAKVGRILWTSQVRVQFSGRRFRHGMLFGWYEYIESFVRKFMLHRKRVMLRAIQETP